jgi:hypothetical protein
MSGLQDLEHANNRLLQDMILLSMTVQYFESIEKEHAGDLQQVGRIEGDATNWETSSRTGLFLTSMWKTELPFLCSKG